MAFPTTWPMAEAKLKQLFPDATQRGTIKGKLLEKTVDKRLEYFQDEDTSVKASLFTLSERLVVQDPDPSSAYAKVQIRGPTSHFEGFLLLDTGCTMEVNMFEYKATKIGLTDIKEKECEIDNLNEISIALRGWAPVTVCVVNEDGQETWSTPATWLEIWTDEGTADPTPPNHPAVAPLAEPTVAPASPTAPAPPAMPVQLGAVEIEVKACSPIKRGKDKFGNDMIIGLPGMIKLGIFVNASGRIIKKKRQFKK